jgi:hypothetical protein
MREQQSLLHLPPEQNLSRACRFEMIPKIGVDLNQLLRKRALLARPLQTNNNCLHKAEKECRVRNIGRTLVELRSNQTPITSTYHHFQNPLQLAYTLSPLQIWGS